MRLRISRASLLASTLTPDTTPDAFSFTPVTSAGFSILYTSNVITVAGLGAGQSATIDVFSGQYALNGATYTSASGTVVNGDSVSVCGVSSSSGSTTVAVTLNIGGVSASFLITTMALSPTVGEMVGFFFPLTKAA